jgi:hypothetical protein
LELFSLEEEATQLPGGLFVSAFVTAHGVHCGRSLAVRGTVPHFLRIICWQHVLRLSRSKLLAEDIMFCDGCGTAVQAGQAFCPGCGKQIVGPVSVMQPRPGRVQEHVHLLALLWLAISAFNMVGGVVLYVLANTLFAHLHEMGAPEAPTSFLRPLLSVLAIIVLAKALLGFVAGWGLLQREGWARVVALVLAFISLFNIPFGTAVGVYTMWVLLPSGSEHEYEALVGTKAA